MRTRVTILLVAALMLLPTGLAAWGAKGDSEPSTLRDTDGYMFASPNEAASNKVYFNGWLAQQPCWTGCTSWSGVATITSFNPNVATLRSGVMAAPSIAWAMLGIWRDCNKDGYIGLGDQGLFEYPVRLASGPVATVTGNAVDTTICPVTPVPQSIPPNAIPAHNDGGLIREFLPIGWNSQPVNQPCRTPYLVCQDVDPFNVADNQARVWSDFGTPGAVPGNLCYVRPHPHGTWHSVGSIQSYADCFLQNRINNTITAAGLAPTFNSVRGTNCHQSSILGAYSVGCNPWGESSQAAYVDAFDCKKQTPGPYVPQGNLWTVNRSEPYPTPRTNPQGSPSGTINETWGDFDDCRENNQDDSIRDVADPNVPYALEGDTINTNGLRLTHDTVMLYQERKRPAAPVPVFGAFSRQGSGDLGLGTTREADFWQGRGVLLASRNPYVARDALEPASVTYVTYYATVGAAAISAYGLQLPGATGTYGSEACGVYIGAGQPPRNSWACDPDAWWPGSSCVQSGGDCARIDGQPVPAYVRVGQTYQLRDVDCYDAATQTMRDQGVTYHGLLKNSSCVNAPR